MEHFRSLRKENRKKDKEWIDKQILCMARHGVSGEIIERRYQVSGIYIAKLKKKHGVKLRESKDPQKHGHLPTGDLDFYNVKPKKKYCFNYT